MLDRLSSLQKLVVLNAAIVLVGAVCGTLVTRRLDDWPAPALIALFFAVGGAVIAAANYVVLRGTFRHLVELSRSLEAVHKGERIRPLAEYEREPTMREVSRAVDDMLERIAQESRAYSSKIFESIEDERRRIGRELHDETSQSLAAALLNLDMASRAAGDSSHELQERIDGTRRLVRHCLEQIKLLVHDLRPSMLDDFGLVPALRWYVQTHLADPGLTVVTDFEMVHARLPADVETALYRIAQESLANVVKHAAASRVELRLEAQSGYAVMVVTDNGRGFDSAEVMLDEDGRYGVGLLSIKERAGLLEGEANIVSQPGRGTSVHVVIPLQAKEMTREASG